MTDMLIPNRPPKGKSIDEILAGMPAPDESPNGASGSRADDGGFKIEDCGDYYRMSCGILTYDFLKQCPMSYDLYDHVKIAESPHDFMAADAETIYEICRELYIHRHNEQYGACVSRARADLSKLFQTPLYTLSQIAWHPEGSQDKDYIIRNVANKNQLRLPSGNYTGNNGLISAPETNAEAFLYDLLNTSDSMNTINDVFKWITGADTTLLRLTRHPDKNMVANSLRSDMYVEHVLMGIFNDAMRIGTSENASLIRPAMMIRHML